MNMAEVSENLMLTELPLDIYTCVLTACDRATRRSLAQVNRECWRLSQSSSLWHNVRLHLHGTAPGDTSTAGSVDQEPAEVAVDGDEDKAGAEGRPAIGPRGLAGLLSWVKGRRDVLRNILFSTLSDTDICYHKSRGMQLLRVPIVDVLTALAGSTALEGVWAFSLSHQVPEAVQAATQLPCLADLDLRWSGVAMSAAALEPLTSLAALTTLWVAADDLEGPWDVISRFTRLRSLGLLGSERFLTPSEPGHGRLAIPGSTWAPLTQLSSLCLYSVACEPFSLESIAALSSSLEVLQLDLPEARQSEELALALPLLPKLAHLALDPAPAAALNAALQCTGLCELELIALPQGMLPSMPRALRATLTQLTLNVIKGPLPPSWCCPKLEELTFKQSKRRCVGPPLPSYVSTLTALRRLEVSSVNLEELPKCVLPLTTITWLSLERSCNLEDLPAGPYLQQLRVLVLDGTRVDLVPPCLAGAPMLRKLSMRNIRGFKLRVPDVEDILCHMCSLRELDVTRREWRQTAATPCMSHHANDLPAQAWLAACKVLKDARPDVQLLVDKWETEDEMPQPAGMEFVLP